MPLPEAAREYLFKALEGTPIVLRSLVADLAEDSPLWDRRPDPDRFTLREVLAHLADWEPIWLERVSKIAMTEHPFLPSVDESAIAVENDYASVSPRESLRRIEIGRAELVAFLRTLPEGAWDRTGDREFVGVLTLQQQAVFALTHDGYHLRQVAEFRC